MKAMILSAAVLSLLLLGGLVNNAFLCNRCEAWQRQLGAVETSALEEDWHAVRTQLSAIDRSWRQIEPYLHIALHHEETESAAVLLDQCRLFAVLEDEEELLLAAQQLHCQYRHIAETEELRFVNIF